MSPKFDLLMLERIQRNFKALSTVAGQVAAATVSNNIIKKYGYTSVKPCIMYLRSILN